MIKRMNALFLGGCLLAAIILEVYCIQVYEGDLFSSIGIGLVVLITGYLFMDSLRSVYKESFEKLKQQLKEFQEEEIAKRNSQYEELLNLQKANYTAVKKSEAFLVKQLEETLKRIDNFESSNVNNINKMIELQKKTLEGQKNALNLEIKYNKDNTKEIIAELQSRQDYEVLKEQVTELKLLIEKQMEDSSKRIVTGFQQDEYDFSNVSELEKTSDNDSVSEESASEEYDSTIEENMETPKIVPLYDDPNKALTADEIATLFASLG